MQHKVLSCHRIQRRAHQRLSYDATSKRQEARMPAPLSHIETSPDLPRGADVVVIGGGFVGVFAAYYLTLRGLSVALVETGRIGAEQASRIWGWSRRPDRDARASPTATPTRAVW